MAGSLLVLGCHQFEIVPSIIRLVLIPQEAYRQLEDQGLISVRPQSGYYVCAPSNLLELEERYVSEEKVSLFRN